MDDVDYAMARRFPDTPPHEVNLRSLMGQRDGLMDQRAELKAEIEKLRDTVDSLIASQAGVMAERDQAKKRADELRACKKRYQTLAGKMFGDFVHWRNVANSMHTLLKKRAVSKAMALYEQKNREAVKAVSAKP